MHATKRIHVYMYIYTYLYLGIILYVCMQVCPGIRIHGILSEIFSLRKNQSAVSLQAEVIIWVVVKIGVPFWVPIIIRHLIFRVPKTGP